MTETQTINKTEIQREENGGSRYLQTRVLSQRPLIRAYLGDCMDWMQTTADKDYQLAIVDPPYGIGKDSLHTYRPIKGAGKLKNRAINLMPTEFDEYPPKKEYFIELRRVSVNQIIWGGNYFDLSPTRGIICWDKVQPWENFSQIEYAWTSFDYPAKLFRFDNRTSDKIHPTQKPIALYRWLLKNYAKAGQRILDTHGGSFSSAVACYMEGFDLDICEIDEEYFESAIKRFKQATQQIHLFDERLL